MKVVLSNNKSKNIKTVIATLSVFLLFLVSLPIVTNSLVSGKSIKHQAYVFVMNRGYDLFSNQDPIQALLSIPQTLLREKSTPQKVLIDINYTNFASIRKIQEKAQKLGMHVRGSGDDWVKAKLTSNKNTVDVKVRLKGDSADHWRGRKWSLKIKTKGDSQFKGQREFSFQHPVTRGFQGEFMVLETMRKYGLLAPRYDFINLILNGEDKGIMAVEESFGTELLEFNRRKDGVIFKLDETNAVIEKINPTAKNNLEIFGSFLTTYITPFNQSKVSEDEAHKQQLAIAQGLMRGFMDNSIMPSDVFEIEKIGKFLSILEIFGAAHTMDWRNIRFYLNPYTLKVEPISYDSSITNPAPIGSIANTELGKAILADPIIFESFKKELVNISKDILDNKWFSELSKMDAEILKKFGNEFIFVREFPFNLFKSRINNIIQNPELSYPTSEMDTIKPNYMDDYDSLNIDSYLKLIKKPIYILQKYENKKISFEVYNPLPNSVNLISIASISDKEGEISYGKNILDVETETEQTVKIPKNSHYTFEIPIPSIPTMPVKWLFLAQISDYERIYEIEAITYSKSLNSHPLSPDNTDGILNSYSFIDFDKDLNSFFIRKGTWEINSPIFFPKDASLVIEPGTEILFNNGAYILMRGPIDLKGTPLNPIVLRSKDKNKYWQGLIVLNAQSKSSIKHSKILDTTSVVRNGWNLTGAITFYNSDVVVENSIFKNNIAEDALNIIDSEFEISSTSFHNATSDFIDADYSDGIITKVHMENSLGDGLDLSGSSVHLTASNFTNIRDKAISVGENSNITIENININQVGTGLAVKDGSHAFANNLRIDSASYSGIAVYRKKPVYNYASSVVNNLSVRESENNYIVQNGNTLELDGSLVEPQSVDIDLLYKTIMKKNLNE